MDELFQRKATMLAEHPKTGRAGRVPGTRELVAHRHYVLIYDFDPAEYEFSGSYTPRFSGHLRSHDTAHSIELGSKAMHRHSEI